MEGITTFVNTIIICVLLFFLIPSLAIGLHLWRRRPEQKVAWLALLGLSALLLIGAVWLLVTLPRFDFVDRCRPPGTGMCLDGRTHRAVRLELLGEFLLAALLYIALPIGLGAGGILLILHRITGKIAVK